MWKFCQIYGVRVYRHRYRWWWRCTCICSAKAQNVEWQMKFNILTDCIVCVCVRTSCMGKYWNFIFVYVSLVEMKLVSHNTNSHYTDRICEWNWIYFIECFVAGKSMVEIIAVKLSLSRWGGCIQLLHINNNHTHIFHIDNVMILPIGNDCFYFSFITACYANVIRMLSEKGKMAGSQCNILE